MAALPSLTTRQLLTLRALCRIIVPVAFDDPGDPDGAEITSAVATRMATLPPDLERDLRIALVVLDHPVSALLFSLSRQRFTDVSVLKQEERLRAWSRSPLGFRRSIYQAVRRLVLSTYYAIPEHAPAIGYRGPLRNREPVVPWEGPLPSGSSPPGDPQTDGVIATHPDSAHVRPLPRVAVHPAARTNATDADVCIIGSGAGGSVAAARLAEAGLSVIVVEEGGNYDTADFTDIERDMMPRLYADAGARATDDGSISLLQGRCVGGGTTVNWMLMLRPRTWVMHEWEQDHGAEMLGAAQLEHALTRVEHEVGAGFIPDVAHSPANRIVLDGSSALGWSAEPAMINARGCVRAGTCGIGCSHGAKRSAGKVFLPRAVQAGARIIANTRAERIDTSCTERVVHCSTIDPTNGAPTAPFSIRCKAVVLAAGAVGTPVILQRSGMGGGGVGRYLRLHPTTAVTGSYDRVMYGAAGVPQSALVTQFMDIDDGHGFWIECPPLLPSLAAVALTGFGSAHRQRMQNFPNLAALIVLTRDGADKTRSNGSVLLHRSGRVHIRYSPSARDRRIIRAGIMAASQLHLAAGAREAVTLHDPAVRVTCESDVRELGNVSLAPNRIGLFSAHVNGTCRMGTRPETSGCDPDGQRHGHPGIFIADGSIFPSAPGVHPQATIMAIGSLVSERVLHFVR
jgi:choline dehydrogenase-like flavoprotein